MAGDREAQEPFTQEDHQVAYIFDPYEDEKHQQRPSKRRRMSKQTEKTSSDTNNASSAFVPLLNGVEEPDFVQMRQRLFEQSWERIDGHIQNALRDSNTATLDQVSAFVGEAQAACFDKIPSAFIITGPNIASQNLLFEQLSESLQSSSQSKFVRLRSSEASTLKAALKKTLRDVMDDDELDAGDMRRGYLDYDLEALHAFSKAQACKHVFVAFEDSEGFDSSLLSDLIPLFNSWRPQIPFTLLFGVATSVELLQARLLKSVCQQIHGAQFDAVQSGVILETVFKIAVAADDVPLRIGAPLLQGMLERQHDQVAGIQAFASSLKYAYMCHFYANALSSLQSTEIVLQPEHLEAIRHLPSFRALVESAVEAGNLYQAQSLIEDDAALVAKIQSCADQRQHWVSGLLRSLLVQEAALGGSFSTAYVEAIAEGVSASEDSKLTERVRLMGAAGLAIFIRRVISVFQYGEQTLSLNPSSKNEDAQLQTSLSNLLIELENLHSSAQDQNITLRSTYNGQSKVMRTTVIAQRVQLSRDSAALSEEDKAYTSIIDSLTNLLDAHISISPASSIFLSECWTYDSKAPSHSVFVPRPRAVLERSLMRPTDYLSCACCTEGSSGIQASLPPTSILYQLYLETGSLINVADLWAAFHGLVGQDEEDERKVLVSFYRGLAELRALGFVKGSKKKVDHVAKLKWL